MNKLDLSSLIKNDAELDEYGRQVYKNICEDKDFYELIKSSGFSDEEILDNIGFFEKYHTNHELLKKIKNIDDCYDFDTFFEIKVVKDGEAIKLVDIPLPYTEKNSADNNLLLYCDAPKKMIDKACRSKVRSRELKTYIAYCYKNRKWAYVIGGRKTGKTFACLSYVKTRSERKDSSVALIDLPTRIKYLRNMYLDNSNRAYFDEIIGDLSRIDILVFDNFGESNGTKFVLDSILLPILKARKSAGLPTIFTSIYSPDVAIKEMVGVSRATKERETELREALSNIASPFNLGDTPIE
jgi:hypothetical protein